MGYGVATLGSVAAEKGMFGTAIGCLLTSRSFVATPEAIRLAPIGCVLRPYGIVATGNPLAVKPLERDAATCGHSPTVCVQAATTKERTMALNLSLSEILANLERRIESLRGQVEVHARQEEHHREQRSRLEAELQKVMGHFESFQAVAATAEELDLPAAAPAPPPPQEEDLGHYPTLARMVARVVDGRPEGERFGSRSVVEEVNERFRKLLRRAVEPPDVSVVLRRMSAARRIHQVRRGKPNHEALYVKGPRPRPARGEDADAAGMVADYGDLTNFGKEDHRK